MDALKIQMSGEKQATVATSQLFTHEIGQLKRSILEVLGLGESALDGKALGDLVRDALEAKSTVSGAVESQAEKVSWEEQSKRWEEDRKQLMDDNDRLKTKAAMVEDLTAQAKAAQAQSQQQQDRFKEVLEEERAKWSVEKQKLLGERMKLVNEVEQLKREAVRGEKTPHAKAAASNEATDAIMKAIEADLRKAKALNTARPAANGNGNGDEAWTVSDVKSPLKRHAPSHRPTPKPRKHGKASHSHESPAPRTGPSELDLWAFTKDR